MSDAPQGSTDEKANKEIRDYLDWVERMALENLRFHIQSAEVISKEANTTLTLLLAGAGAALSGAVTPAWTSVHWIMKPTLAGLSLMLFGCAVVLVWTALKIRDIPVPTNSAGRLSEHEAMGFDAVRRGELQQIDRRKDECIARNNDAALVLNRVRFGAIAFAAIAAAISLFSLVASGSGGSVPPAEQVRPAAKAAGS